VSLLEDLRQAEVETARAQPCPLCEYIGTLDGVVKSALRDAAAGTIGIKKLESIMQAHETGIGRRTIIRHRQETHQP
jgi:hypothetical protein